MRKILRTFLLLSVLLVKNNWLMADEMPTVKQISELGNNVVAEKYNFFQNRKKLTHAWQTWRNVIAKIGNLIKQNAPEMQLEYAQLVDINDRLYNAIAIAIAITDDKERASMIDKLASDVTQKLFSINNSLEKRILILPKKRDARSILKQLSQTLKKIYLKYVGDSLIFKGDTGQLRKKQQEGRAYAEKQAQEAARAEKEKQLPSIILVGKANASDSEILGLGRVKDKDQLTDDEKRQLKTNYKKLALKWHPDKLNENKKMIQEKLNVLGMKDVGDEKLAAIALEVFKRCSVAADNLGLK